MEGPIHPRARISAVIRQHYREEARCDGENNNLWLSAWSKVHSITNRFHLGTLSADDLDWDLHDLWYLFYEASANIAEESPALDRLVLQVIQTREQGLLARENADKHGPVQATTSDGRLWTDLPFLIPDMTGFWLQGHATMPSAQRLSFSKFLAKLASSGVGRDDGLCSIALTIFRQALETPRTLGTSADRQRGEDSSRGADDLSIAAYLPSVNVWFCWAGLKIIQLSETGKSWSTEAEQEPGPLCRSAEIGLEAAVGFCTARWIFWLTRLEHLVQSFEQCGENDLAKFTTGIMDNMLIVAESTGGRLSKAVNTAYTRGTVQYRPSVRNPPSNQ